MEIREHPRPHHVIGLFGPVTMSGFRERSFPLCMPSLHSIHAIRWKSFAPFAFRLSRSFCIPRLCSVVPRPYERSCWPTPPPRCCVHADRQLLQPSDFVGLAFCRQRATPLWRHAPEACCQVNGHGAGFARGAASAQRAYVTPSHVENARSRNMRELAARRRCRPNRNRFWTTPCSVRKRCAWDRDLKRRI